MRPQQSASRHDSDQAPGAEKRRGRDVNRPRRAAPLILTPGLRSRTRSVGAQLLALLRNPRSTPIFGLRRTLRSRQQQRHSRGTPPHRSCPVVSEKQDSDGDDVVVRDAVVGVAEVDAGDGVGAAESEVGCLAEEEGGESYGESLTVVFTVGSGSRREQQAGETAALEL